MTEKLCTFEDILLFKDNHKDVSTNNSLIEKLIEVKSAAFIKYCGVDGFKTNTYTEYFDGGEGPMFFVHNTPLKSVTNIWIDTEWQWGSDTTAEITAYRIVNQKYVYFNGTVPNYPQVLKMRYIAGYDDIPEDLKQATVEEVVRSFNRRNVFDVTATSMPDGSVSYTEKGWLKSTLQILNYYKKIGIY